MTYQSRQEHAIVDDRSNLTLEDLSDRLIAKRHEILNTLEHFPPPTVPSWLSTVDEALARPDVIAQGLAIGGAVQIDLDRDLSDDEFIALSSTLGPIQPEDNELVKSHVQRQVILNLRPVEPSGMKNGLHPFTVSPVSLHTEGTHRPRALRPRYLLFSCIAAPGDRGGGQTLLVASEPVAETLCRDALKVLSETVLAQDVDGEPICRAAAPVVFHFSDTLPHPIAWRLSRFAPIRVRAAMSNLLAALYDPGAVKGITWISRRLVVIDNNRWFHGRTRTEDGRSRHIRRIRVLAR